MAKINLALPRIDSETLSDRQAIRRIESYIYQLNEQLRYELTHIDEDNMAGDGLSAAAISPTAIKSMIADALANQRVDISNNDVILSINNRINNIKRLQAADEARIAANTAAINTRASQSALDALALRVNGHDTSISEIWTAMSEKASAAALSSLSGTVTALGNTVNGQGGAISALQSGLNDIKQDDLWLNRSSITATAGKWSIDENGNMHLDGSALYLGQGAASLGVYTNGNLTAGVLVEKLSDGTSTTKIKGDYIDFTGVVRANQLEANMASILTNFAHSISTSSLSADAVSAGSVAAGTYYWGRGESQAFVQKSLRFNTFSPAGASLLGLGSAGDLNIDHYHAIEVTESGGTITITQGAAQNTPGTADFDMAATKFFKDAVAAAKASVKQRSASTISAVTLLSGDTGSLVQKNVTITYDDDEHNTQDLTMFINASAVYSAGRNDVTINKGSWSGGSIAFTKSAGTASTKTVSLEQGSASWRSGNYANIVDVPVLDGSLQTGLTVTVNAVSRYNAGYTQGSADGWEIGNQQGVANGTNAAKAADIVRTDGTNITFSASDIKASVPLTAVANQDSAYNYSKTVDIDLKSVLTSVSFFNPGTVYTYDRDTDTYSMITTGYVRVFPQNPGNRLYKPV